MSSTIYGIRCRENGRMYIGRTGSALNERFKKHVYRLNHGIHDSKTMQDDFNRFGKYNFDIIPLFKTNDSEYAKRLEKIVILTLGSNLDSNGYNRQDPAFRKKSAALTEVEAQQKESFLKRRILSAISESTSELSKKTGYSEETIEAWKADPFSIRAVDLERLEDLLGKGAMIK